MVTRDAGQGGEKLSHLSSPCVSRKRPTFSKWTITKKSFADNNGPELWKKDTNLTVSTSTMKPQSHALRLGIQFFSHHGQSVKKKSKRSEFMTHMEEAISKLMVSEVIYMAVTLSLYCGCKSLYCHSWRSPLQNVDVFTSFISAHLS